MIFVRRYNLIKNEIINLFKKLSFKSGKKEYVFIRYILQETFFKKF